MPYISPSKQKILDALAVEKERLRQEMMADDFRDRALMAMMDGVLEHKWEDEIKKPVWKPSCMVSINTFFQSPFLNFFKLLA